MGLPVGDGEPNRARGNPGNVSRRRKRRLPRRPGLAPNQTYGARRQRRAPPPHGCQQASTSRPSAVPLSVVRDHCEPEQDAVDTEWVEVAAPEIAHQEVDRDHRDNGGGDRGDHRGAPDAVAVGAGQVRDLVQACGEDDRRRQQEPQPGRVVVIEPAGEPGGHDHAVAADPGDQGGRLSNADDPSLAILERFESSAAVGLHPLAARERTDLRAFAQSLGADQDQAVHDEEDRGDLGFRGRHSRLVLEQDSEDPDGDAGDDDQPCQPLCRGIDTPLAERPEERPDDLEPGAPEVDQQSDRAADMQHHDERKPRRFGLRLPPDDVVPPEQGWKQHRVPEARDREQLGDSLQGTEHDRLEARDQGGRKREHEARNASRAGKRRVMLSVI